MNEHIALCIDGLTCSNPQIIGLDGEVFEAQRWLDVYVDGESARNGIVGDGGVVRVWVLTCDDVEPINLAAALKADRPDLRVKLVTADPCGSLYSRAHTAGIDEVLDLASFVKDYVEAKASFARPAAHATVSAVPAASGAAGPIGDAAFSAFAASSGISSPLNQGGADAVPYGVDVRGVQASGSTPGGVAAIASLDAVSSDDAFNVVPLQASRGAVAQSVAAQPLAVVAGPRAFVFPIVSGSGGSGKSSVSVVAGLLARDMGCRTLLLDYDLQFGDAASLAGVEKPLALDTALAHPDLLEREIAAGRDFVVLAAPSRLEAAEDVVHAIPRLIDRLGSGFDLIVANTGAAWAEQQASLLERSSAALFLVDQRASSIWACKHALELCARCGIASSPFRFAVNRCGKGAPLTSADVSSALGGVPVFELRDGGADVEDYLSGGAASELIASRNEFCQSVAKMLERVLPVTASQSRAADQGAEGSRRSHRRGSHAGRKRGWSLR